MRKWSIILLPALALTAACASAPATPPAEVIPPTPPPVNPVGVFDFTTTVEGTIVNGTVTVVKTDTGFGGSVTTTITEPIPVRAVTVAGQKLTVTADTPDGPLTFTMDFKGDEFAGAWSFGTQAGTHTGKRRKA